MAGLKLEHIEKKYDDGVSVIGDFNLEIEDKEFVVFVGPSGCGKSTTLRMIAGLEKISGGKLFIDNKEMTKVKSCDRDIAMVFQNYALYPHMNVFQNIAYSLRINHVPKKQQKIKVDEVAKVLHLEGVLDRKPGELSGGQKQRVAIGRAIVRNPKVFLMDEPLSNLDAKLRDEMRNEIQKLYRQLNTTFIYVTHDQKEAMTLGTKVVVMDRGDIQQVDTPQNIYDHPANLFVASFIGIPQMNFLTADCKYDGIRSYAQMDGKRIDVKKELQERIMRTSSIGRKIVLGIRPECVIIVPESDMEGEVTLVENLGSETYIYFDYKGTQMISRMNGSRQFTKGDRIYFRFELDKLHLFDKASGKRI